MVTKDVQADENKIVFFSAKNTEEKEKPNNDVQKPNEEVKTEKIQYQGTKETEKPEDIDEVSKTTTDKGSEIDKKVIEENQDKPKENPFTINEGGSQETATKDKVKETEPISEKAVLDFLKEKGIEVETVGDLSKREVLSEPVLEFKKYNEKTGRGIDAYINSRKDWTKAPEEDTIREYLRYSEPNLSEEDIENEIDLIKLTEDERDDLSEREVKSVDQKFRKTYAKALAYMKNVSKEYSLPLEEKKIGQQQISKEDLAKAYKPYWDKRDKSLEKLNDISINVKDLGEIKLPVSDTHKELIAKVTETQEDYFQRWLDKDGLIDTDKSSLDVAFSIPEIRNELHSEMINQVYNLLKEKESKTRRNVTLDGNKTTTETGSGKKGVITFNSKSNNSNSRMGQPLIPPRK